MEGIIFATNDLPGITSYDASVTGTIEQSANKQRSYSNPANEEVSSIQEMYIDLERKYLISDVLLVGG